MSAFPILRPTADEIVKAAVTHSWLSDLRAFQHVRGRTCRGFNAARGMERSESQLCATEVYVISPAVDRRIRNALIA
jgi:hypothetical protein